MSKRKGPILIHDLIPKIKKQTATLGESTTTSQSVSLDSAKSAYQFISEGYKSAEAQAHRNSKETGSNRVQIGSESGSNRVQKQVQIGCKSGSEKNSQKPSDIKSGSESGSTLVQIGFKSGSNQVQNVPSTLGASEALMARGDQRKILDFFFDSSVQIGDRTTPALSSAEIGNALQMPQESVRTALKRLLQRGSILRRNFQRGRSGWSSYELSQSVYRELLDFSKSGSNRVQIRSKSGSKSGSESGSNAPSSSSFLDLKILKTTTTEGSDILETEKVHIPPEWQSVDVGVLSKIGFTQTHLIQIARLGKLSCTEVESSMEYFAFDLQKNGKAKLLNGSPLNFFMGILRKGIPYAPPENYESPADEARRRTLEILESRDRERVVVEQKLKDLKFSEWRSSLSENQAKALVPVFAKDVVPARESMLRAHFDEKVYPTLESPVFGIPESERIQMGTEVSKSVEEVRG